ncbi:MAG: hypothetical protein WB421_04735 [Terriglobales bacterium]
MKTVPGTIISRLAYSFLTVVFLMSQASLSQDVGSAPDVNSNRKSNTDIQGAAGQRPQDMAATTISNEIRGTVKVTVDADKLRLSMAPRALAVETPVSDNNVVTVQMLNLLKDAGVTTLRYPGGGYADNFHWATNRPTNSQVALTQRYSNFAANNDFGHFVALVDRLGTAVITVNYGSNQDGTGGGEPAEAAAWVAYANGKPTDTKAIGKDSTGYDWQTVGYWASLRASAPLASDDGKNFLRINHPQPLDILYWEVGNEVYLNGYFGGEGEEVDFHAPYAKDSKDNAKTRQKNPSLSPDAYGKGLVQFSNAMKAVDPRIKIGASLDLPVVSDWNIQEWTQDPITKQYRQATSVQKPTDSGLEWDRGVMKAAGKNIDFVSLHWYVGDTTDASGYKDLDNAKLLNTASDQLPKVMAGVLDLFQKYCGNNAQNMQLLITGMGLKPYINVPDNLVVGLFTTDAYLSLIQAGAANIDWTELEKGGFLDDINKPGPAYFGMQMVHFLMNLREPLVTTTSSNSLLSVYAAKHADGSMTLMFINKDPKNVANIKVNVSGAKLASSGMRFDFGRSNPPTDNVIAANQIDQVGNSFNVTVPAYTISDVLIPKAK